MVFADAPLHTNFLIEISLLLYIFFMLFCTKLNESLLYFILATLITNESRFEFYHLMSHESDTNVVWENHRSLCHKVWSSGQLTF